MLVPKAQVGYFLLHNMSTANGGGAPVDIWTPEGGSYTTLTLQVTQVPVGTVTLQASVDGVSWFPVLAENVSTGAASSVLSVGLWRLVAVGFRKVRVLLSDYSSGALHVVGVAVA